MKSLPHILFPTLVLLPLMLLLVACGDSHAPYTATGIGSVELNDSTLAIHYYKTTLRLPDNTPHASLTDTSRVYFSGSGTLFSEDPEGAQVYDFNLTTLSSDITTPIITLDSTTIASDSLQRCINSTEGFYAQNLHITRDWRRNDFFDATASYPGVGDGSSDFLALVATPDSTTPDTLQLWLRLLRHATDSSLMVTKHISVPVNCLRDTTRERIVLRLSRINSYSDTVVIDYVYSYVNFIE